MGKTTKRNWNFIQPKDYKLIPLSKNKLAVVDNEDFDKVKGFNWYISENGYALSNKGGYMHRLIMNPSREMYVDHIDRDKLNNRKSNLRVCTRQENAFNSAPRRGTSKFKGVYWNKKIGKWHSIIFYNGKRKSLGYFESEEDAARAYDNAAEKIHKDFVNLNIKQ